MVSRLTKYSGLALLALSCGQPSNEVKEASLPAGIVNTESIIQEATIDNFEQLILQNPLPSAVYFKSSDADSNYFMQAFAEHCEDLKERMFCATYDSPEMNDGTGSLFERYGIEGNPYILFVYRGDKKIILMQMILCGLVKIRILDRIS